MSKLDELIKELCPNGIEYKKMSEVGIFLGGITGKVKSDFEGGNAKFINYKNVYSNPALKIDVPELVKIHDGEKQHTLKYGDVIFTGSSETPEECGISSVLTIKTDEKLYLNSFCFIFRFNDLSNVDPNFMKHFFRSSNMRKEINKTANGVTRFNVSKKLMANIEIPIIPLAVQKKISFILDIFSELTSELTSELVARKKQYEYYRDSFYSFNPLKIKDANLKKIIEDFCSKGIELKALKDVCNLQNGFAFKSEKFRDGGFPIIRISNITGVAQLGGEFVHFNPNEYKEDLKKYVVSSNTILIAMSGATTGKIGYIYQNEKYYINQRVGAFIPITSKLNTRFLFHWLLTKQNEILGISTGGGAQPNLSSTKLMQLKIPIPPLKIQGKIVQILDTLHELCNSTSNGIPGEIEMRKKQYEYYRDKFFSFDI